MQRSEPLSTSASYLMPGDDGTRGLRSDDRDHGTFDGDTVGVRVALVAEASYPREEVESLGHVIQDRLTPTVKGGLVRFLCGGAAAETVVSSSASATHLPRYCSNRCVQFVAFAISNQYTLKSYVLHMKAPRVTS